MFNISKYVDESGQVIEPIVDQETGIVRYDFNLTFEHSA